MYNMMVAGAYGGSVLNPIVSSHLWKLNVVARVVYVLVEHPIRCLGIAFAK